MITSAPPSHYAVANKPPPVARGTSGNGEDTQHATNDDWKHTQDFEGESRRHLGSAERSPIVEVSQTTQGPVERKMHLCRRGADPVTHPNTITLLRDDVAPFRVVCCEKESECAYVVTGQTYIVTEYIAVDLLPDATKAEH